MKHMIQKPDSRAHGDLLRCCKLGRMACILGGYNSILSSFGFFGIFRGGEMGCWFVRWENPAVEGDGDLDFGFVGDSGDSRCSLG